MLKTLALSFLTLALTMICGPTQAENDPVSTQAQSVQGNTLHGDEKLACEAILCLSATVRPKECNPSIRKYFSIHRPKAKDTIKARKSFLNQCPTVSTDPNLQARVAILSNEKNLCGAAALNASLMEEYLLNGKPQYYVRDSAPAYCADGSNPAPAAQFVGTSENGGFWIDQDALEQPTAQP